MHDEIEKSIYCISLNNKKKNINDTKKEKIVSENEIKSQKQWFESNE